AEPARRRLRTAVGTILERVRPAVDAATKPRNVHGVILLHVRPASTNPAASSSAKRDSTYRTGPSHSYSEEATFSVNHSFAASDRGRKPTRVPCGKMSTSVTA